MLPAFLAIVALCILTRIFTHSTVPRAHCAPRPAAPGLTTTATAYDGRCHAVWRVRALRRTSVVETAAGKTSLPTGFGVVWR